MTTIDLSDAVARISGARVLPIDRAARSRRGAASAIGAVHTAPTPTDWALVRTMRESAAKSLAKTISTEGDEKVRGGRIVDDLLLSYAQDRSGGQIAGGSATADELARLRAAVMAALFGLGRLQPLVDDPTVENIEIRGYDNVWILYADGRIERGEPVADSDEELIDTIAFIAARSRAAERPFDRANPRLEFTLDGGARLSASAWFSARPYVAIRRHRLQQVTLGDLLQRGMFPPDVHDFLGRAVRARKSIIVSGPMGSGKTTMVRALAAELPPAESIATVETEFELHLHELDEQHPRVFAWETRPGTGEPGADGRRAGEITLDDLVHTAWRYNADRIIVGEIRGAEVMTLLRAAGGVAGVLCTVHAKDAHSAVERMVTLALGAGPHVTVEHARRSLAQHIDFIVQLGADTDPSGSGKRRRYVSQIVALEQGEAGVAVTDLWRTPRGSRSAVAQLMPVHISDDLGMLP